MTRTKIGGRPPPEKRPGPALPWRGGQAQSFDIRYCSPDRTGPGGLQVGPLHRGEGQASGRKAIDAERDVLHCQIRDAFLQRCKALIDAKGKELEALVNANRTRIRYAGG